MPNFYTILGVAQQSEDVVIRAAYRALMQKYHPDKWAGNPALGERRAREITEAYATLSDKRLRADYDRLLAAKKSRRSSSSTNPKGKQEDTGEARRGQSPPPGAGKDKDPSPQPAERPAHRTVTAGFIGPLAVLVLGLVLVGAIVEVFGTGRESTGDTSAPAATAEASAPSAKPVPFGAMVEWDAARDGAESRYIIGPLTVTLGSRMATDGVPVPTLTVAASDMQAFTVDGVAGFENPSASFGVGRLDARNPVPQVVFTTFSGGAHCCVQIKVLEARQGRWRGVDLGAWDGELADFPKDLDGDGLADFVLYDDRFLYAFASYAESMPPPLILNVAGGKVREVSNQPKYASLFRAHLADARAECLKASNAGCAAFVADAARLGLRDWAWGIMLTHYDRASAWGLPEGCAAPQIDGRCPEGRKVKPADFPQALEWFLADAGYTSPAPARMSEVDALSPSFDCSKAETAVLKLICNTPAIAEKDRRLAAIYNGLLGSPAAPGDLKVEQRRWLAMRNNLQPSAQTLGDAYDLRILELERLRDTGSQSATAG